MPSLFPEPALPASSSTVWVNAHCDGGARGNPGPAGYGAVLVDDAGQTLAELSEYLGHRTNNFAEYSGLLGCLQWTLDHGHRNLRVVSDSELMVKQIQGKYKVNSPDLRPLWEEARRRIVQLDHFQITHALRHKNKAADQLANDAMDRGSGRTAAGRPGPAAARPLPTTAAAPSTSATPLSSRSAAGSADSSAAGSADKSAAERSAVGTTPATNLPPRAPHPAPPPMLRGFTRGGTIHLLGSATLPDGVFVKIIQE